jgi:hypothetical protein
MKAQQLLLSNTSRIKDESFATATSYTDNRYTYTYLFSNTQVSAQRLIGADFDLVFDTVTKEVFLRTARSALADGKTKTLVEDPF